MKKRHYFYVRKAGRKIRNSGMSIIFGGFGSFFSGLLKLIVKPIFHYISFFVVKVIRPENCSAAFSSFLYTTVFMCLVIFTALTIRLVI